MGEAITRHSPRPPGFSRVLQSNNSDIPCRENAESHLYLASGTPLRMKRMAPHSAALAVLPNIRVGAANPQDVPSVIFT